MELAPCCSGDSGDRSLICQAQNPEISPLRPTPDAYVALNARITAAIVLVSASRLTRIAMPSISSSITLMNQEVSRFSRAERFGAVSNNGDVSAAGTKA